MTEEEVLKYFAKNEHFTGIKTKDRKLFYDDADADCIDLELPETPLRATYFARVAAMLGTDGDESMFYGAMLWITISDIGSPQLEKTGWKMVELMRHGFGDNRPLEVASGHWFRNGEVVECAAFVLPCFVFSWDAYLVPSRGGFFVQISNDEARWTVATRNKETYRKIWGDLKNINPREGHKESLQTFCPGSSRLSLIEQVE